jgi:hypothetical protein
VLTRLVRMNGCPAVRDPIGWKEEAEEGSPIRWKATGYVEGVGWFEA